MPRTPDDHLNIYRQLCGGMAPVGLAALPIDEIKSRLPDILAGWRAVGDSFERADAAIQCTITPVWTRFDLYGKWTGDDANTLIDLMQGYGCPLFDPQKQTRFTLGS
ncbi:MAG: hypothetical protein KJO42_05490 [Silicimonas sp.]|nr:hypothetical protein [Silicimonas sp.]